MLDVSLLTLVKHSILLITQSSSFCIILLTNRQTNTDENITSLAEVNVVANLYLFTLFSCLFIYFISLFILSIYLFNMPDGSIQ